MHIGKAHQQQDEHEKMGRGLGDGVCKRPIFTCLFHDRFGGHDFLGAEYGREHIGLRLRLLGRDRDDDGLDDGCDWDDGICEKRVY